jgi:Lon protease-like protein
MGADLTLDDLPAIVPIFPLGGVLLLPGSPLPLHIFEPRYRAMTRDALAAGGYIAMTQPSGETGDDPMNPPVYGTACLGKIVASEETDDGRYNIVLRGICRLRVGTELPLVDGYRQVEADYSDFAHDMDGATIDPAIDRESLLQALKRYLERRNLKANWDEAAKAPDGALVNSLAVGCPFSPQEKQALLEAHDIAERAQLLQALCEMDTGGVANDNTPRPLH